MASIDLNDLSPAKFPTAESESFEFKSSGMDFDSFAKELSVGVSAFANSGGGCLIWGADNSGNVDGGIAPKYGRQDLKDWLHRIISQVSPPPSYDIQIYIDAEGRGVLEKDKVIAAISVPASNNCPHMASDNRYYIRGGTHSNPAPHFLVEALWARRQVTHPVLSHIIRSKPHRATLLQLGVIALNSAPAVEVRLNIVMLKDHLRSIHPVMPIHIPVVNVETPFFMDLSSSSAVRESAEGLTIEIDYRDIAGKPYKYRSDGNLLNELTTIFLDDANSDVVAELRTMNRYMWDLIQDLRQRQHKLD